MNLDTSSSEYKSAFEVCSPAITGIRRQLNHLDEKYQIKQFGELPFSTIYEITDSWQGTFKAVVHFDPDRSSYAKN